MSEYEVDEEEQSQLENALSFSPGSQVDTIEASLIAGIEAEMESSVQDVLRRSEVTTIDETSDSKLENRLEEGGDGETERDDDCTNDLVRDTVSHQREKNREKTDVQTRSNSNDEPDSGNTIGVLDDINKRWIECHEEDPETALNVALNQQRILDICWEEFVKLCGHVQSDQTKWTIVAELVARDEQVVPLMFTELESMVNVSQRTLYSRLSELENDGIIVRIGKPASIEFSRREIRLLAEEVLWI
ncbi:hypothetical protein ACFO0N_08550 [Halobium salinum]|uniref:Helix-turn-helix domain-containing protein n=1 Tax=Halobium salinum TaxID=1364940 RepID=A0ABD5PAT2_9EURY|nr:hypothetical protein [Halobium salinum]